MARRAPSSHPLPGSPLAPTRQTLASASKRCRAPICTPTTRYISVLKPASSSRTALITTSWVFPTAAQQKSSLVDGPDYGTICKPGSMNAPPSCCHCRLSNPDLFHRYSIFTGPPSHPTSYFTLLASYCSVRYPGGRVRSQVWWDQAYGMQSASVESL